MQEDTQVKTKTLYKAMKVLDCFSVGKPELGVTDISEQLGLYKSNVHNMLDTFVKSGYLEQNAENGKYRLSNKILELAYIISSNISFRKTILPYMQELAESTGETIYLAIPDEGGVLYLDSASPKNTMTVKTVLGIKAPLYCTGIGKAMLAYMPEEAVREVLSKELVPYTETTITDPDQLRQELVSIRTQGFSVDHMEHQFGIKCVGVPVLNNRREVVAGLSISGPSLRFDEANIREYAGKLSTVLQQIAGRI
jgi:DNA-binding IclR family transcriptional regulator